jgi:hypothetical protein
VDDDALQQNVPADSEEVSVWVRQGQSQEQYPDDGNVRLSRSKVLRVDITRKVRIAFSRNIPVDLRLDIAAIFICMFFVQAIDDDVLLLCAAKDETSVQFMRPLLNSWAECSVVISC